MLHHGHKLDTDNRARAPPIFQTTSFEFKSAEHGGALFELSQLGPIYTRLMNPTTHVLEYKVAKLEGAPCKAHGDCDNATTLPNALAVASGQSAQMHALLTFMSSGDNFVASSSELYGGTYTQFKYSFANLGIEARFFNAANPDEAASLIDENTKCIYLETISNPSSTVPDFEKYVEIAKTNSIPIVCDNTFGQGGWTCKPLAWGADIVVESATKWIGGHGTSIGGIIVDGSSFDWRVKKADGSLKYPLVAGPQESYHGGDFANHPIFGVDACNLVFILLARVKTLRDMGGCIAPVQRLPAHPGVGDAVAALQGPLRERERSGGMAQRPRGRQGRLGPLDFLAVASLARTGEEVKWFFPSRTPSPRVFPAQGRAASVPCSRLNWPETRRTRRASAARSSSRPSRCAPTSRTSATRARS